MLVPSAAAPARAQDKLLVVANQIGHKLAGRPVFRLRPNDRARGNLDDRLPAVAARFPLARAGLAILGEDARFKIQGAQAVGVPVNFENHIPAPAPVAPIRPSLRHILVPDPVDHSIPPISRLRKDLYVVDKHPQITARGW